MISYATLPSSSNLVKTLISDKDCNIYNLSLTCFSVFKINEDILVNPTSWGILE